MRFAILIAIYTFQRYNTLTSIALYIIGAVHLVDIKFGDLTTNTRQIDEHLVWQIGQECPRYFQLNYKHHLKTPKFD